MKNICLKTLSRLAAAACCLVILAGLAEPERIPASPSFRQEQGGSSDVQPLNDQDEMNVDPYRK